MGKRKLKIHKISTMKFFLALIAVCAFAHYARANTCAVASYCMSCNTTSQCTGCFNWGSGKVGARSLATNVCTAALTRTIAKDVKFYSGTHTSTSTWAAGAAVCKGNKYMVVDQTVAA